MITALETGCRLVLIATLLTLVAIFAAFRLGRPAGRATTSGARWSTPRTRRASGRCNRRERSGAHGGAHRRWWLAFYHTEPGVQGVPAG